MTWPEVQDLGREIVVLIPTGSIEQHGPHLPLGTDTRLAAAAAQAVEARLPDHVLLTPTLWLGMSGHHLAFSGTLSASEIAYSSALESVIRSLSRHGFYKFYVLNGHGGNADANSLTLRRIKEQSPELMLGHSGYFAFGAARAREVMEGPLKEIRHACEAEASLMMHLALDSVRSEKLRDDGLYSEPAVQGMVHFFDEMTQEGSFGYATLATAEKGRAIFEACVDGAAEEIRRLAEGYLLVSRPRE